MKFVKEKINFTKFVLINPKKISSTINFVIKKLYEKTKKRAKYDCYPGYIKEIIKKNNKTFCPREIYLQKDKKSFNPCRQQANDDIELTYSKSNFYKIKKLTFNFFDKEQILIFHRFNWLLTKLTEFPNIELEWGLEKIQKWIRYKEDKKQKIFWETYSASERICNSLFFYILTAKEEKIVIPDWLCEFIRNSADYIVKNLEFRPGARVTNHTINNARGLYFAGVFLGCNYYKDISYAILHSELPKVITDDGFLREGSSHYHFLITRWLLEIMFISRLVDDRIIDGAINNFAKICVRNCWFFLVRDSETKEWRIPLIGDVSPDFCPDWLIGLPWSRVALFLYEPDNLLEKPTYKGWSDLFSDRASFKTPPPLNKEKRFYSYNSGWYRLDFERFTFFWHIQVNGSSQDAVHGHCDSGGVCLYIDGYPALVDIGRYNYTCSALGRYGISAAAHNSITIDRIGLVAPRGYPDFYNSAHCNVVYSENNDKLVFKIVHDGFSRIPDDKISFERIFYIEKDTIQIVDKMTGKKQHNLKQFFHFYPETIIDKTSANSFRCKTPNSNFTFTIENLDINNGLVEQRADWYFPSYGKKIKAPVIETSQKQRFPFSQRFTLKVN